MKTRIVKLWKVALVLGYQNPRLRPIAVGGHDWSAKHLWWRIYKVKEDAP
jgi:hypothetical protein